MPRRTFATPTTRPTSFFTPLGGEPQAMDQFGSQMPQSQQYDSMAEDADMVRDMIGQGFDENELNTQYDRMLRSGGRKAASQWVKSIYPKPKPRISAEDALDQQREEEAKRIRTAKTLYPTHEMTTPEGKRITETTMPTGSRVQEPIKEAQTGFELYKPEEKGFEGLTPEGEKWTMARDIYGSATPESYKKETRRPVSMVDPETGKRGWFHQKVNPDTGDVELTPAKVTMEGKPIEPLEKPAKPSPGELRTWKNLYGALYSSSETPQLRGVENEIEDIRKDQEKLQKKVTDALSTSERKTMIADQQRMHEEIVRLEGKKKKILDRMSGFKNALKKKHGDKTAMDIIEQLQGSEEFSPLPSGSPEPDAAAPAPAPASTGKRKISKAEAKQLFKERVQGGASKQAALDFINATFDAGD